ncbi:MAG: hypothetical protein ACK5XN_17525 [Bacteroidota bacterium]
MSELVDIYKGAPPNEKNTAFDLLVNLDPSNRNRYDAIKAGEFILCPEPGPCAARLGQRCRCHTHYRTMRREHAAALPSQTAYTFRPYIGFQTR